MFACSGSRARDKSSGYLRCREASQVPIAWQDSYLECNFWSGQTMPRALWVDGCLVKESIGQQGDPAHVGFSERRKGTMFASSSLLASKCAHLCRFGKEAAWRVCGAGCSTVKSG